jgi:molybdopterin-guanine dinucleotide biosynthesis protein A
MGRLEPIEGYVLAGGASRRFGEDKALAILGGEFMLARMCRLLDKAVEGGAVVCPRSRYETSMSLEKLPKLEDRWPGEGPLGGILTALHNTKETRGGAWNLILGCDMPFLTVDWLAFLCERARFSESEVVVPQSDHGLEPLCACWRTSAAPKIQSQFDGGVRKVTEAMKQLHVEVLDEKEWKRFDTTGRLFWNMNTVEDYEEARRVIAMENS